MARLNARRTAEPAELAGDPRPGERRSSRRITPAGVAAAVGVVLVAAVCTSLGFWQLDRLEQRRARNDLLRASFTLPIIDLDANTLRDVAVSPERYQYRQVRVRGRFAEFGRDVVLRGRAHIGQPGVHLLTPLQLERAAVLVNRGWVPSADAATVDPRPYREAGEHEVRGLLLTFPRAEGRGVPATVEIDGARILTLGRLDVTQAQTQSSLPLLPFFVQQLPDPSAPELPKRLSPPALDDGPHLSYAVQWFSLAAVFLIGFAVFVVRKGR